MRTRRRREEEALKEAAGGPHTLAPSPQEAAAAHHTLPHMPQLPHLLPQMIFEPGHEHLILSWTSRASCTHSLDAAVTFQMLPHMLHRMLPSKPHMLHQRL